MPDRSASATEPGRAFPASDPLLVINNKMGIACRVVKEEDGFFTLFAFEQITGLPLRTDGWSLLDVGTAIAEAHKLVYLRGPVLVDTILVSGSAEEPASDEFTRAHGAF